MKIGVVIQLVEMPDLRRALSWSEIKETVQEVEGLGFDSIWVYDHLLYRNKSKTTGIWEGWSMLSAMAAITQKVELGTLVSCNSFRNPALLAKMAHTVDEISGGRLILGIGAGWNQPEYEAFGFPFNHRASRFEEAIQIIHPLIKTGKVDFSGKFYQAINCEITPTSPRIEGIPLLISAFGPKMMKVAAQYADMWNVCYMSFPRSSKKLTRSFRHACQEMGREFETIKKTYTIHLAFPDLLGWNKDKKRGSLSGSAEELAIIIKEYEDLGSEHLMFHLSPSTQEAYRRLEQAVELYKSLNSTKLSTNFNLHNCY